jgi:hypothetical protein
VSPAARAADLVSTLRLGPDDLVVAAAGGATVLAELRRLGCRVLAVDPAGDWGDAGIDTVRTPLTPAVARVVRDRYGPAAVLLVEADVPPAVAAACLAAGGAVVRLPVAPLPRAA